MKQHKASKANPVSPDSPELTALNAEYQRRQPIHSDEVLHAHQEILDLFAQNSGDYDPTPDEVDAINDGVTLILGNLISALSNAAPDESVRLPKARGVSRDPDWSGSVAVYFDNPLTDDELRGLHEVLAGRAMLSASEKE